MKQSKIHKNRVRTLIFLALLFIGIVNFLIIYRDRNNTRASKANSPVSPIQHHQGEINDIIILSLSERSNLGSRFKIRVTTPPDFDLLPLSLGLTKSNSEKLELLLQKATTPYDCTDTHDYNKDRIGYESQWFNGNLEDYQDTDLDLTLRAADNSLRIASRPFTHSCSIFSEDVGETGSTSEEDPFPSAE